MVMGTQTSSGTGVAPGNSEDHPRAEPKLSLRERHALETRERIVGEALALFVEQGFDATTVDEIAAKADVSPRTFFRYFATKDALLFHDFEEQLTQVQKLIAQRPESESAVDTLVAVLKQMIATVESTPAQRDLLVRLLSERPSLRAYQREAIARHGESVITGVLAARASLPPDDAGTQAVVASVFACFDVALQQWTAHGAQQPFDPFLDQMLSASAAALAAWTKPINR